MIGRMFCGVSLLIVLVTPAAAQSSAHYSMKRISLVGGSANMASSSFTANAVGSQESPVGGASFCNVGPATGLGFWSVLGHVAVPIVLSAQRDTADPGNVDLFWSGADPTYQLYRAYTPSGIFNPANLEAETSSCSTTDPLALQSSLIFYSVIRKP